VLAKMPQFRAVRQRLVTAAREDRPHALVLIDFPDFNFSLAPRVKALGVPVIYYISPQVWAWRPGRMKTIRRLTDLMLVIFPFEEQIYRDAGVPVAFVGHPLIDLAKPRAPRDRFLDELGLAPQAPTIAVLPGSRDNEVARIFPDLLSAARRIRASVPDAQFVIARAPGLADALFDEAKRLAGTVIVEGDTDAVLASADVALTASGTATVQTAIHGTPMVVVYRLSPLTYRIVRRLVKVDAVAMVNLIAGRRIVPELIQDDFTPDGVAAEAVSMLTDSKRAAQIRSELDEVRQKLGAPGASRRAAQEILRVVEQQCDRS
jgi:lipid-A-disaccharide synthase